MGVGSVARGVIVAVATGSITSTAVAVRVSEGGTLGGGITSRWAARTWRPLANTEKGLGILEHATVERLSKRARRVNARPRPIALRPALMWLGTGRVLDKSNLISSDTKSRM